MTRDKGASTSEELIAALAALYAVVVWIGFIVSFALFSSVSFFLSFSRRYL